MAVFTPMLCLLAVVPIVALATETCQNAITRGVVGRPCTPPPSQPDNPDIILVSENRRLRRRLEQSNQNFCNLDDTCTSDSVYVTLGNGCFWERQYAYYNVETDTNGPFKRQPEAISARVGYIGSTREGHNGEVCYHSYSAVDYSTLGHAETVLVRLDKAKKVEQFTALVKDFFGSFTWDGDRNGMRRPDDWSQFAGDHGAAYRSLISIPGGVKGELYRIVKNENKKLAHPMTLMPGVGADPDNFNTVFIIDSHEFHFYVGEAYHQFHSNFFGPSYEPEYLKLNQKLRNHKPKPLLAKSPGCNDS